MSSYVKIHELLLLPVQYRIGTYQTCGLTSAYYLSRTDDAGHTKPEMYAQVVLTSAPSGHPLLVCVFTLSYNI